MVEHIVLFQMKPETGAAEKRELVAACLAMKGRIPGVIDLSAGDTFTDRHKGFTVGLVVRFTDKAALEAYGPHPNHEPVKALVKRYCDDVLAVDYEF